MVDDAQVVEVMLGADGVIEGVGPETIIALHSKVLPETVQMLASKFAAIKRMFSTRRSAAARPARAPGRCAVWSAGKFNCLTAAVTSLQPRLRRFFAWANWAAALRRS